MRLRWYILYYPGYLIVTRVVNGEHLPHYIGFVKIFLRRAFRNASRMRLVQRFCRLAADHWQGKYIILARLRKYYFFFLHKNIALSYRNLMWRKNQPTFI